MDLTSVSALKAFCQVARNGTVEDHRGEKMEDIAEVQEEPCIAANVDEANLANDEAEMRLPDEPTESNSLSENTFRSCMQEKVRLLPVPAALKDYLLFYRK